MPRVEWSFLMPARDHQQVKWLMTYGQSRLTPWGQILFAASIAGCFVSSIGTQISAYFLPCFILSLLITSYLLSLFFRPSVSAYRILPPTPSAGGYCSYKIIVKNTGKRPLRNLTIFEQTLPYGLYAAVNHPKFHNTIDWLDPDEHTTVMLVFHAPRRGSFELLPFIVGSHFPSGIMRSRRCAGEKEKFIVFPPLIRKTDTQPGLRRQYQPGGFLMSFKAGDSNEFSSTREYRQGDRLRDVHWASSAKTGTLIVKEYVEEYFIRAGLFLDTELRYFEKHKWFEHRISLCAGIADILISNNYIIDLFLSDEHQHHLQIGRGIGHFHHLLNLLSAIEGDRKVNFPAVAALLKEHGPQLSMLTLFLKDWDLERSDFVHHLKEMGINLRTIIIRDKPTSLPVNDDSVSIYSLKQLKETS